MNGQHTVYEEAAGGGGRTRKVSTLTTSATKITAKYIIPAYPGLKKLRQLVRGVAGSEVNTHRLA